MNKTTTKFKAGLQEKPVKAHTIEKHYYITGAFISKKMFDALVKRYKLVGDKVMDGKRGIAYRIISNK